MSDNNIQMKKRTGSIWDKLFPITKTKLVLDQLRGTTLDNVLTNIYERITKVEKKQSEINVKDFGAVGDGETNDTKAFQNAINQLTNKRNSTLIIPPSNGKFYLIDELTIPNDTHVILFEGIGDVQIKFTNKIGFHIKSEFIVFKNINFTYKKGQDGLGIGDSILFNDEREYSRLDFDIDLQNCKFAFFHTVVKTNGRGVVFKECGFNDISGFIIDVYVLNENAVSVGSYDIHEFATGYRGYTIKNCRIHYCNQATIMRTTNDTQKVLQGVEISHNIIEGGIGYFKGYLRNSIITDNLHYQTNTNRTLFELTGSDNVYIKLHCIPMNPWIDKHTYKTPRVLTSTGKSTFLTVTGMVESLGYNAITLYGGGEGIEIDLNVRHSSGVDYDPSLLMLAGDVTYNGIIVKGLFFSNGTTGIIVNNQSSGAVVNVDSSGLMVLGTYGSKTNIV